MITLQEFNKAHMVARVLGVGKGYMSCDTAAKRMHMKPSEFLAFAVKLEAEGYVIFTSDKLSLRWHAERELPISYDHIAE